MEVNNIDLGRSSVYVGKDTLQALQYDLTNVPQPFSQMFILCDDNTIEKCLPELLAKVPALRKAEHISVPSGEQSKSLEVCQQVWGYLQTMHADRYAILVSLGGGVVTDIGGFIAGTYKRGIRSMSVPTSLMGQVDAAIGGKTGIDMDGVKNVVGLFHEPLGVYVHVPFLRTLGKRELLNGLAEMIKHGLVKDADHWQQICSAPLHELSALAPLIERSIVLKSQVVLEDPTEQGIRRMLNFGHTIGHVLEAHSWESQNRELLHGEAIAIGMICASWLSNKLLRLSSEDHEKIESHLLDLYPEYPFETSDIPRLIELMRHDKKNKGGKFQFTLLNSIGDAITDVEVSVEWVKKALEHYRLLLRERALL